MNKKQIIKELIDNKSDHIELKKAQIKHTNEFQVGPSKVIGKTTAKGITEDTDKSIKRTIIGNTYNWLDSHGDVHVKGCFTKSIKERSNKIFHLHDHEFKISSKVGKPIDIYEKELQWKELGVDVEGSTTALHMDSEILKEMNNQIFQEYKSGSIDQHSVGMVYVKIDLAVDDEDYEEEFKLFNDIIDTVGNKEEMKEMGYAWIVREAKLIEISCVLAGSNILTPTLSEKTKNITLNGVEEITPTFEVDTESLQELNKFYNNLTFIKNE